MEKIPTIALYLDTRFSRKDDEKHPVKLRVTFDRKQKYFSLSKWYSPIEWAKVRSDKPGKKLEDDKIWLDDKLKKAKKELSEMVEFNFDTFENRMFNNTASEDVFLFMQSLANKIREEGREKTAISYESSIKSIKDVTGKTTLKFMDITPDWLNKYQSEMLNKGRSSTTVGIYLRNLRTTYNKKRPKAKTDSDIYPFGKAKYRIPGGKKLKRALSKREIGLIYNMELPQGSQLEKYRDYFIFSYLCNGINIKDMANLRYKNIQGQLISFERAKTANANKENPVIITCPLIPKVKEIIERWGNKPRHHDKYIFPILKPKSTSIEQVKATQREVDALNRNLKTIAKMLGIEMHITGYVSRHTYASVLKNERAPLEFISEGMGHTNVATTKNYLSDFEIDTKIEYANRLTSFED
jgi:integrase